MFSHSAQALKRKLTVWIHVQPFLSVVLICSNTREQLTFWMYFQQLVSGSGLLSIGKWPTFWMYVQPFSWLVLFKHWKTTHSLKVFSHSCQWFWSESTQYWRVTHLLNACLVILISGSDLLKQRAATHFLKYISNYLVSEIHDQSPTILPICPSEALVRFQKIAPRNATYILWAFHKPDFHGYSTQYCAHILNYMSISNRGQDYNWTYIALLLKDSHQLLLKFCWNKH